MKAIDLKDKRFGKLLVVSKAENIGRRTAWNCKCDCGNNTIVTTDNSTRGGTKSCGNCFRGIDETGNKYGKLTVLKIDGIDKNRMAKWECQCDCGNIVIVRGSHLRSGHTQSCGHHSTIDFIDETNNRYGMLKVIKKVEGITGRGAMWECKCDCGNTTVVRGANLRQGFTNSCGCLQSNGEAIIKILLDENNINYSKEYTFGDLNGVGGGLLRFDFAVFKDNKLSHLIEFDGSQHYDESSSWHTESLVENDNRKNEYCKKHNIPLIRLRDYKNLTVEKLEV